MHELAIVTSVLEQLDELQKKHAGVRISKVGLRVGELSGVDVECLRFGFECAVMDTHWAMLLLEIEPVARRQRCPRCQHEFAASAWEAELPPAVLSAALPFTACPKCGEAATVTVAGEELQIAFVEVEDGPGHA
jgi:hydrogenase nickel incorporation protein HypA/HybF